jgi:hypothetical protein
MTLGQALAAQVRLIVWCNACGHQAEPDSRRPGRALRRGRGRHRLGAAFTLLGLRGPRDRGRQGDFDAGDHLGDAPCDLDQAEADRVELCIAPERCPGRKTAQGQHQPVGGGVDQQAELVGGGLYIEQPLAIPGASLRAGRPSAIVAPSAPAALSAIAHLRSLAPGGDRRRGGDYSQPAADIWPKRRRHCHRARLRAATNRASRRLH